ncbi:MerR family transcriptional regulator [Nocardioides sp. SR21]|uniref:MerR family transcriptional regulator n=1 Tax=Nocardioides sp. SR21 TaxID=2919501 RepID=UPI001FAAE444|nr:MerR family transcriptional regulator [Nocardioides sp. SR21]
MYTIKRAAERVGVSESTLRAWERRYGVGTSRRSESGYRLYDEQAVRALSAMNALINEGWSARLAAAEVLRRTAVQVDEDAPSFDRALVQGAEEFDLATLTAVLEHRFNNASFESVVDGWLLPSLREVGLGWEAGRVSVAGEHLVSGCVVRRLAAAYEAAGEGPVGPRIVIGLPPKARHDLGLMSFATAARRAGLATSYLGADVPVEDWVTAVTARSADAAVLAIPMERDVASLTETVAALQEHAPDVLVAVGGGFQDLAPDHCLRLGHQVGPAAALLAERLQQRRDAATA